MQQTEQFKLNQWQKDDRIRMDDFNTDNLKIETALQALNQGLEGKLGKSKLIHRHRFSGTFTSTAINIPSLFKIDWGEWEHVAVLGDIVVQNCDDNDFIDLDFDPNTQPLTHFKAGPVILLFSPRHNAAAKISGFGIGHGVSFFSSNTSYQDISAFFVSKAGNYEHRITNIDFRFLGIK